MLFEDGIHPLVARLDFTRLCWKLTHSSEATLSEEQCAFAEAEYRKFLTLKILHPTVSLVPSKTVDDFWHAHILDTHAYRDDCNSVFGYFLDHFPYFGIYGDEDAANLSVSFDTTRVLYSRYFGPYPDATASRCEGHACHVTSTCACRVVGACKTKTSV